MTGQLRILLFGGLRVDQAGRVITRFQTRQTGALLAYLAFHRDRSHPRDLLSETLWPEDPPEVARRKLRIALASLRRQFEPHGVPAGGIFLAERHFLQLDSRAYTTDVPEFERALEAAARADSGLRRIRLLEQAAELYGGELLPGYFEEWILPERLRLAERYQEALQQLAAELKQAGDLTRALHWARRAVEVDPLREEAHHDLMQLLVDAGQPEAAVRAYARLEQLLQVELGRTPGPISRQLAGTAGAPAPPSVQRIQSAVKLPGSSGPAAPPGRQPGSLRGPDSSPRFELLAGTVTLLLADMEAPADPAAQSGPQALRKTDLDLVRSVVQRHGGLEARGAGDALLVVFARAADALAAAIAGQEAAEASRRSSEPEHRTDLTAEDSPGPAGLRYRVRIAVHTGDAEFREGQCHGPILHHLTRLTSAAHAGQIMVSEATAAVTRSNLDEAVRLRDLGLFRLRTGAPPERLFEASSGSLGERRFPPPQAPRAHPGYLPAPLTRFFGREAEIGELGQWLLAGETRLLTLTGPAGVGKTRLALATAAGLQEPFDGAVWFLPLVDMRDPGLIIDRMLDLLHLPRTPGIVPLERVIEVLSRQRALLVIDNFEHLVDDGAAVVQKLLERTPALSCIVTSRRRLELYGEREYSVAPLPLPTMGQAAAAAGPRLRSADDPAPLDPLAAVLTSCPSVQLFVDRTRAGRPDFRLTAANVPAVVELCRRLEGIPLALELAAARAQVLTPAQVLAQLESRFEFLVSRRRGLPVRHQTLRAALDWSFQLLPPELQRTFAALSVFRGGWTMDAAAAVCGRPAVHDHLLHLRERSLIIAGEVPSAARGPEQSEMAGARSDPLFGLEPRPREMRLRMLETLREYGSEQLTSAERAGADRRHAEYLSRLAERAEAGLAGPDQLDWLGRLNVEQGNFRAALGWSLHAGNERADSGAGPQPPTPAPDPHELGLRLGAALGKYWQVRGQLGEGRRWLQQLHSQGRGAPPALRARALAALGTLTRDQGITEEARAQLEEALALFRQVNAKAGTAHVLVDLASLIAVQNDGDLVRAPRDWSQAQALLEESLVIWRELNDAGGLAGALQQLGRVALQAGEYDRARELCHQSLALRRQVGDRRETAASLNSLGLIARAQREYGAAVEYFSECLALYRTLGDTRGINIALHNLGDVASDQADYERASELEEQALALSRELGHRHWEAANLYVLGKLALKLQRYERARQLLRESLAMLAQEQHRSHCKDCFQALALVAAAQADWERAVRLFAQAGYLRDLLSNPLLPADEAQQSSALTAAHAALGGNGFQTAWEAGRGLTITDAIRLALA